LTHSESLSASVNRSSRSSVFSWPVDVQLNLGRRSSESGRGFGRDLCEFPNLAPGCNSGLRVPGLQMSVESRWGHGTSARTLLMRGADRARGGSLRDAMTCFGPSELQPFLPLPLLLFLPLPSSPSPLSSDLPLWPSSSWPVPPLSLLSGEGVIWLVVVGLGVELGARIDRRSSSTLCRAARICAARSSDTPPAAWR
jgi:hypothetical protein